MPFRFQFTGALPHGIAAVPAFLAKDAMEFSVYCTLLSIALRRPAVLK